MSGRRDAQGIPGGTLSASNHTSARGPLRFANEMTIMIDVVYHCYRVNFSDLQSPLSAIRLMWNTNV
jgi:hypothetical protein